MIKHQTCGAAAGCSCRYYYGVDALFQAHPDIVERLCSAAIQLLGTLLDGLVWRSKRTINSARRVNFYIKHLVVREGKFAGALNAICVSQDVKIISNQVLVLLSDTLWAGVVRRQFVLSKVGFLFSLVVFMLSQAILPKIETADELNMRIAVFAGRSINYGFSMLRLLLFHWRRIYKAYRTGAVTKGRCPVPLQLGTKPISFAWRNNNSLWFISSVAFFWHKNCQWLETRLWCQGIWKMRMRGWDCSSSFCWWRCVPVNLCSIAPMRSLSQAPPKNAGRDKTWCRFILFSQWQQWSCTGFWWSICQFSPQSWQLSFWSSERCLERSANSWWPLSLFWSPSVARLHPWDMMLPSLVLFPKLQIAFSPQRWAFMRATIGKCCTSQPCWARCLCSLQCLQFCSSICSLRSWTLPAFAGAGCCTDGQERNSHWKA